MSTALSHEEFGHLAAGYALRALDPEDTQILEEHLADCEQCQSLVSEYDEVSTGLALAADQVAPPPELWERIREQAGLQGPTLSHQHPSEERLKGAAARGSARAPARRPIGLPRWLGAAAAILLLVAMGAWNLSLRTQAHRAEQRVEALRPIQDLVESGDLRAIALRGPNEGRLTVLVSPSRGAAALVADRVADPGASRVYELWVLSAGADPSPAAVFRPDANGRATVRLQAEPPANSTLAVTIEPGPKGSSKPTTPPVMVESRV